MLALAGCGGSKHAAPPAAPTGGCTTVPAPSAAARSESRPTKPLDPAKTYAVTFETNCGSFTIAMDEDLGGLSAASFVQLARDGFYKGTYFHRIAPGFVIQGGDPTGTGTGGPGYTTKDPPPSDAQYPKYTVAMAKAGPEPPGTSGSQFFVMTGDGGLPPQYAIVGTVTKGTAVIDRIGKLGDATEQPTQVVLIEKATVQGP